VVTQVQSGHKSGDGCKFTQIIYLWTFTFLKVMFDKKYDLLHMNPGACGKSGFHQVRTMLRFVIEGDKIKDLEIIEIEKRA
jgi:hypothetical protein